MASRTRGMARYGVVNTMERGMSFDRLNRRIREIERRTTFRDMPEVKRMERGLRALREVQSISRNLDRIVQSIWEEPDPIQSFRVDFTVPDVAPLPAVSTAPRARAVKAYVVEYPTLKVNKALARNARPSLGTVYGAGLGVPSPTLRTVVDAPRVPGAGTAKPASQVKAAAKVATKAALSSEPATKTQTRAATATGKAVARSARPDVPVCKERPDGTNGKGGRTSRPYIPWCS